MWRLTVTYGDYPSTLVHTSKNEHDWTQEGDYWHFSANDDQGHINWTALVVNVRLAIDVQQVEPATAQGEDQETTAQVPPIPPWGTGRG